MEFYRQRVNQNKPTIVSPYAMGRAAERGEPDAVEQRAEWQLFRATKRLLGE